MDNNKKVCGIIAEYNPFHNGHKYQIDLVKKSYETVVVVMSGSFTQRGDVAITDKWSRARSALVSGADLIIELPTVFSMSTAERFAFGGVKLLDSLGCVDALSFGSECGDIDELTAAAHHLLDETPEQSRLMQSIMKEGMPYAAAREKVFSELIPHEILSSPNNILGVEYIKHIISSKSSMIPLTHKRAGSSYSDENINSPMASAAAIRANIKSELVKEQMPEGVFDIFSTSPKHFLKQLDTAAVYHIRTSSTNTLKTAPECTEGLENRIYDAARKFTTIEEITNACTTKRYTKAKIRRIILSSMLGITTDMSKKKPTYARVLGATEKGRSLLSSMKEKNNIDIITKTADYKKNNKMFDIDILATDTWSLSGENNSNKQAGIDFATSPIML